MPLTRLRRQEWRVQFRNEMPALELFGVGVAKVMVQLVDLLIWTRVSQREGRTRRVIIRPSSRYWIVGSLLENM